MSHAELLQNHLTIHFFQVQFLQAESFYTDVIRSPFPDEDYCQNELNK